MDLIATSNADGSSTCAEPSRRCSIIVCTFQRANSLRETLSALKRLETPTNWAVEVIVVDNNSSDDTKAVVDEQRTDWPALRYEFEPAQGLSHARNHGIAAAQGEIILFTDDDVLPEADWLEQTIAGLERYGADACGGYIAPIWEAPPPAWLTERFYGFLAVRTDREDDYPIDSPSLAPFGANMAFRRAVFDKVGLFDTERGRKGKVLASGEDGEMFERILAAGLKAVFLGKSRVRHKVEAFRMTKAYMRRWRRQTSRNLALSKGLPGSRRIFNIPLYVFPQFLRAAWRAMVANYSTTADEAFQREMVAWHFIGTFEGLWQISRSSCRDEDADHATPRKVLVVSPYTHQNGHFVTFPRDVCCGLDTTGAQVTLLHTRPFRAALDWRGSQVTRICLLDQLDSAPRWWRELWPRLADQPSNLCLAWMILKLNPSSYDLVIWTDLQTESNARKLGLASLLGLYRFRTAVVEHHQPDTSNGGRLSNLVNRGVRRILLGRFPTVFMSKDLMKEWENKLGKGKPLVYLPYGLWPEPASNSARETARRALGIPITDRVLLVFGVQAVRRKNLDTLLEAVKDYSPVKPLWLLFIGARVGTEPHPFSEWEGTDARVNVRIENGFVPEQRVADYFAACDAAWANYLNFPGASGVLLQAIGFGRVSVCSSDGEIGDLCRDHNLGYLVKSAGPESLRETLAELVNTSDRKQREWEQAISYLARDFAWPEFARGVLRNCGARE